MVVIRANKNHLPPIRRRRLAQPGPPWATVANTSSGPSIGMSQLHYFQEDFLFAQHFHTSVKQQTARKDLPSSLIIRVPRLFRTTTRMLAPTSAARRLSTPIRALATTTTTAALIQTYDASRPTASRQRATRTRPNNSIRICIMDAWTTRVD